MYAASCKPEKSPGMLRRWYLRAGSLMSKPARPRSPISIVILRTSFVERPAWCRLGARCGHRVGTTPLLAGLPYPYRIVPR